MEENIIKPNNKTTKILITVIILLVVIIVLILAYFLYFAKQNNKKVDENITTTTTTIIAKEEKNEVEKALYQPINIEDYLKEEQTTNEIYITNVYDSTINDNVLGIVKLEGSTLNLYYGKECDYSDNKYTCKNIELNKKLLDNAKYLYDGYYDCGGIYHTIYALANDNNLYSFYFEEGNASKVAEKNNIVFKSDDNKLYKVAYPSTCGKWKYYYKNGDTYINLEKQENNLSKKESIAYFEDEIKVLTDGTIIYKGKNQAEKFSKVLTGEYGVDDIIDKSNFGYYFNKKYSDSDMNDLQSDFDVQSNFDEVIKNWK